MKNIFLKIEDFLIKFSRVFWVIISLLSFIIAITFLILAFNKYFIAEGNPKLQLPIWSEIRGSIFPPEITKTDNSKIDNSEVTFNADNDSPYSREFSALLVSIYNNFEDHPDLIRADITKSSLTTYISSYMDSISESETFNKRNIISGLTQLLNQAYANKDLIKIGNYNNRIKLLEDSIDNYFLKLENNIDQYFNERALLNAKLIASKAQSFIYFYIGVASICTFVFLALFIIIFRVENHLKRISKKDE